jgi:hypothetical protein
MALNGIHNDDKTLERQYRKRYANAKELDARQVCHDVRRCIA